MTAMIQRAQSSPLSPLGRGSLWRFLLEDVRGALIACEQVGAVVGRDEGLQRVDTGKQADEIILAAKREHRVDQVVANTGFALLDLEAVGEEVEDFHLEVMIFRQCFVAPKVGFLRRKPSLLTKSLYKI